MTALDTFPWPRLADDHGAPVWDGTGFVCGDRGYRVLTYDAATSHWSDDLTSLHEQEAGQDHPVDLASRRLAVASMRDLECDAPIVLDVGCSSGFVLEDLRRALPRASVIGSDYLQRPLERLAQRLSTVPLLQFDLRRCPLSDACIDGVTCLNVLEHIDDHGTALSEIHRILKPGGIVHVEVPAGPELFDIYDEHLLHHRRYRIEELVALAQEAGFRVEKTTHLGCFVFPAFWLAKKKNRRKLGLPAEEKQRLVAEQIRSTRSNVVLSGLMKLETLVGEHVSYPWGIRCVAVLRKPRSS
jgi:ubiquinone/menaquinone biosynthesis C-methylase UbiE